MKTILTFLFASFAIIPANAQGNFDTAIQSGSIASAEKVNSLFTDQNTTSAIVGTWQGTLKKGITIMPNAATKDVKIIFKTDKVAAGTIIVLDENGKKVLHQDAQIAEGNNNINIDNFHTLNDGTYTIQLISNNETYTSTFMIWK